MAVASAGPYASLHLAPDRQPHQHPTTLWRGFGEDVLYKLTFYITLRHWSFCWDQTFTAPRKLLTFRLLWKMSNLVTANLSIYRSFVWCFSSAKFVTEYRFRSYINLPKITDTLLYSTTTTYTTDCEGTTTNRKPHFERWRKKYSTCINLHVTL